LVDINHHYAPEILLLVCCKDVTYVEVRGKRRTPKPLMQQLFSSRLTHSELSSLEGQLMSSYINTVAATLLSTNARTNSMIPKIATIISASVRDRRMGLCFELEGELDPITLYTNREISRNM